MTLGAVRPSLAQCRRRTARYRGQRERHSMQRAFTNILCEDVEATARFYEQLLGMKRHFDSDWFVILTHDGIDGLEYGLLRRDHEVVPKAARTPPGGVIVTFVVDDCDSVHSMAVKIGADVVSKPTNMPYGQRRMLVRDPSGTMLDISVPTAPLTEC